MMCQMIGLPPISIMGFGRRWDSSLMRVPMPPARITVFMGRYCKVPRNVPARVHAAVLCCGPCRAARGIALAAVVSVSGCPARCDYGAFLGSRRPHSLYRSLQERDPAAGGSLVAAQPLTTLHLSLDLSSEC